MNKKVTVENLEQLIEEHKKEKIPYKTYEFDSASYTLLLCDINQLKIQLEEKDKKYAKIKDEIYDYLDSNRFCENFENVANEENVRKHIFEILERGKYER